MWCLTGAVRIDAASAKYPEQATDGSTAGLV
jgi:hypothetical protein